MISTATSREKGARGGATKEAGRLESSGKLVSPTLLGSEVVFFLRSEAWLIFSGLFGIN